MWNVHTTTTPPLAVTQKHARTWEIGRCINESNHEVTLPAKRKTCFDWWVRFDGKIPIASVARVEFECVEHIKVGDRCKAGDFGVYRCGYNVHTKARRYRVEHGINVRDFDCEDVCWPNLYGNARNQTWFLIDDLSLIAIRTKKTYTRVCEGEPRMQCTCRKAFRTCRCHDIIPERYDTCLARWLQKDSRYSISPSPACDWRLKYVCTHCAHVWENENNTEREDAANEYFVCDAIPMCE